MRPADIREWLRSIPFVPFRLHLLETISYEIRQPEQVVVGFTSVDVYPLPSQQPIASGDLSVMIAIALISRLEPLPIPDKSSGNGQVN